MGNQDPQIIRRLGSNARLKCFVAARDSLGLLHDTRSLSRFTANEN